MIISCRKRFTPYNREMQLVLPASTQICHNISIIFPVWVYFILVCLYFLLQSARNIKQKYRRRKYPQVCASMQDKTYFCIIYKNFHHSYFYFNNMPLNFMHSKDQQLLSCSTRTIFFFTRFLWTTALKCSHQSTMFYCRESFALVSLCSCVCVCVYFVAQFQLHHSVRNGKIKAIY